MEWCLVVFCQGAGLGRSGSPQFPTATSNRGIVAAVAFGFHLVS